MLNPVYSPTQQHLALRLALHLASPESGAILARQPSASPPRSARRWTIPSWLRLPGPSRRRRPPHQPARTRRSVGLHRRHDPQSAQRCHAPADAVLEASTLINEANGK
ncbi:MAG: hypothetical protein R2873_04990 [Caldilineaceae bacterium]